MRKMLVEIPVPKFAVTTKILAANKGERPAYKGEIVGRQWIWDEASGEWIYTVCYDGIQSECYTENEIETVEGKCYVRRW
jgi:hypothetical protein